MTLMELMIVLAMIAIVAAIAIPAVGSSSGSYEAVEQARRAHSEMARLRARAVAERVNFRVELAGGEVIRYAREDSPGVYTVYRADTLDYGTTATLDGATGGTITFRPSGRLDDTGGMSSTGLALTFTDGGHQQTVRVLPSGMARWE